MRRHLLPALAVFAIALALRWWLVSGLILGDDGQEFGVLRHVLSNRPNWNDQLQVRWAGWVASYVAGFLFGLSETTALLPSIMLSAAFPVLGYALLVSWGANRWRAVLGALVIATAPFEVVLGTVRVNDLWLAGALAAAFAALVFLEDRPRLQGVAVATALWLGFYVKLFVVYAFPALGLYALAGRRWRAVTWFVGTSVVLHGAMCVYWKAAVGTFVPFVTTHAAHYAVATKDLTFQWLLYPRMIFVGSEFRTTLFGLTPYLCTALVGAALVRRRLDRPARLLLGFGLGFFLFLEFFPAGFALDAYYTVPRIFRYLAPISFPLSLLTAKLLVDATRSRSAVAATAIVGTVVALQVAQAAEATLPGRVHRRILGDVVRAIEREQPPKVVAEITLGYWLEALHLDPDRVETEVVTPPELYVATDVERWIRETAPSWPAGTLLVTGLGNYVHYGAHHQGARLAWFDAPLDDRWTLVGDYGIVSYLPRPEAARLWRLTVGAPVAAPPPHPPDPAPPAGDLDPTARFQAGMERLNAGDHPMARAHLRLVLDTDAREAEDAAFFYAVTFFRDGDWVRAAHALKRLRKRRPATRWLAALHWHLAICDLRRGRVERARDRFRWVIRRFPQDAATVEGARVELQRLHHRRGGFVGALWSRLTAGARP